MESPSEGSGRPGATMHPRVRCSKGENVIVSCGGGGINVKGEITFRHIQRPAVFHNEWMQMVQPEAKRFHLGPGLARNEDERCCELADRRKGVLGGVERVADSVKQASIEICQDNDSSHGSPPLDRGSIRNFPWWVKQSVLLHLPPPAGLEPESSVPLPGHLSCTPYIK